MKLKKEKEHTSPEEEEYENEDWHGEENPESLGESSLGFPLNTEAVAENLISFENLKIIENYKDCPVSIGGMARKMGIKVLISSFSRDVPYYYISSSIQKENDGYVIKVNRYEVRERQRYSIAREIAHFLLHKDIIDRVDCPIFHNVLWKSELMVDYRERKATSLALDLLVPKDVLALKINDDIEELKRYFRVNEWLLETQIENINKNLYLSGERLDFKN